MRTPPRSLIYPVLELQKARKKKKRGGYLRTPSCMVCNLQHKLSQLPHLKLMSEWTAEDAPSFLSVKKMSQVELRNAVVAESLPNQEGAEFLDLCHKNCQYICTCQRDSKT